MAIRSAGEISSCCEYTARDVNKTALLTSPLSLQLYQSKDSTNHIAHVDLTTPGIPIHLVITAGNHDLVEDILLTALIMEFKLKMFERLNKHDLLYGPILGSLIAFK